MKTKTLTLNDEQFNIVLNAVKNFSIYQFPPSEILSKKIDELANLLTIIPYNEEINQ